MAGVGVLGGYGPAAFDVDSYGQDYPPGPSAWLAGQTWPLRSNGHVYAADLNQQLSQPVEFLSHKPVVQVQQQVTQNIASNSTATSCAITHDTQIMDPWGMRSVSTDTSQVTVSSYTDGVWLVQGQVSFAASASSGVYAYEADLYVDGALYSKGERWAALGSHVTPSVADLMVLPVESWVQLYGWQNSGASVLTFANGVSSSALTARWVAGSGVSLPGGQMAAASQTYQTASGPQTVVPLPGTNGPLLTPPSPGTWTSLQEATSAQFNSDIRNSVLFLANVPVYRATQNTSNSIAANTNVGMTNMGISIDNWGAGSGTVWTAPVAGVYLVGGQVAFATGSSAFNGTAYLNATLSGVSSSYPGVTAYGENIASMALRTIRMSAGDTIQLGAISSAATTSQTGSNTRLFTVWLSK
jgi:hypothetical protein